jgi:hypothetical protein
MPYDKWFLPENAVLPLSRDHRAGLDVWSELCRGEHTAATPTDDMQEPDDTADAPSAQVEARIWGILRAAGMHHPEPIIPDRVAEKALLVRSFEDVDENRLHGALSAWQSTLTNKSVCLVCQAEDLFHPDKTSSASSLTAPPLAVAGTVIKVYRKHSFTTFRIRIPCCMRCKRRHQPPFLVE